MSGVRGKAIAHDSVDAWSRGYGNEGCEDLGTLKCSLLTLLSMIWEERTYDKTSASHQRSGCQTFRHDILPETEIDTLI